MILHITNDYSGSTVYKELISAIDLKTIPQIVFHPIKSRYQFNKNNIEFKTKYSKIIYANILNKHYDRIFYKRKVKKISNYIENTLSVKSFKIIHAHTWYSDGGTAYLISKKYGIPYITTIRNSDIHYFYKYQIFNRVFAKEILLHSSKIIVLSPSYKNKLLNLYFFTNKEKEIIESKIEIIPNGVNNFWIKNFNKSPKLERNVFKETVNILYVGKFSKGKNLEQLINAITKINKKKKFNLFLHIVGHGGNNKDNIMSLIKKNNNYIKYYGKVEDRNILLDIYRSCDIFAMPSKRETFGLVYIEALLQGLPILFTKGEGIDGLYNKDIGESLDNINTREIEMKIYKLINSLTNYKIDYDLLIKNHNWYNIAGRYLDIYNQI